MADQPEFLSSCEPGPNVQLLYALQAFGEGDFLVRLPVDGLSGIDAQLAQGKFVIFI
jgi:hypothetical protein